ncbi:unnamed protein product (macronuclear) [Paramecium tetraurelia]|uniref:Uncharacterized protein n=1 Tax=Paramecium tetraurelia TaxID=5888 RepID=A0EEG7_PARTE|nr:uncharacterized protein GSPATT00026030001 [Paramecium tetraurelia]CAK93693.1 unnamed protein product [Paramecium tetraurelia]|eukprot:XP_001461081.1 hypothetical protein (macronuclear) [Paramecium tetraurelia strain d4-2]
MSKRIPKFRTLQINHKRCINEYQIQLLTGKKEMIDTELEFFIADRDTIDDFLYEIDSSFVRIECGKMFDSIDLIFFEGDANLRPWSPNAYKFLILLRMCMRSNKILFASSFAMQGLVFLIASNIECQISIINGLNGSQLGDLSKIKKSMNEIRMSDYFLDNVTGDLYSFNYDTGEWVGKGNAGLHSRRAAEEFKTIGKYIVKAPQYKVQRMKEIDQLYVSKENEVVCSLRKNSMHNYLFYDLPFEFVVPFKNSWDVHPFNFVNPKKTFQTMAECEKGPLVICISDNIVATQFSIRTKYKETVQMLRNFMGYQLTKLCSGRAQTIPIEVASIKQNDNAMDIYLEQLSRSKYSNQKTIKFNVITEFHHAGFAAKKSNQLDVVVNNAIGKKKFKQTQQKLNPKDLDQLLFYSSSPKFQSTQQQEIERKPSIYSAQPNHFEEKPQAFQKTNLEIIQILHPSIDTAIFTQNKPFWVPGYLSQCRLQKSQMSKKQNTTSEDGPSNTHILTEFKQNTTPRMPRNSSQPHFRVIQKDKWMTNKDFQV